MVAPVHHLVGPAEVAEILGVSRQRVTQLAARDDFPRPVVVIKAGQVWHTHEIEEWQRARDEAQEKARLERERKRRGDASSER